MQHMKWLPIDFLPSSPTHSPSEFLVRPFPGRTPRSWQPSGKRRVPEQEDVEAVQMMATRHLQTAQSYNMAALQAFDWTSKWSTSNSSNVEDRLLLDIRKVLYPLVAQGEGKRLTSRQRTQSVDFDLAVRLLKFLSQHSWLPEIDAAVQTALDGLNDDVLTVPQNRLRAETATWLQAYADHLNHMDRSARRCIGGQYLSLLPELRRRNASNCRNFRTNAMPNRWRPSRPIPNRTVASGGDDAWTRRKRPVDWERTSTTTKQLNRARGKRMRAVDIVDIVEESE
jgi:hypothetical protein